MNINAFFEICKAKGIAEVQLFVGTSKATSIKLFHREIDSYKITESRSVAAYGIYNGKFGYATTEKLDRDAWEYLADRIVLTASFNEKEEEASLFKGSEKYRKGNVYNKTLPTIPLEKKLADLKALEEAIYAASPLVTDADCVSYAERESLSEFYNSYGLKLKRKTNYFSFSAGAVARKGEETKTFYDSFFDNDYSKFDKDKLAKKIVEKALAKFGGAPCESKKYPTVLHRDIMADLVDCFLGACSADEVQRHSSFLEGKLGQKIASAKLTIEEKPLAKTLFYSYFDDEGVATKNKVVVKRGVLQTYFHNRETAKKAGVETTANGAIGGGKIGIGIGQVFIKGGKKGFDEMIAPIHDGVFITEIAGLGTGLNPNSGDFSVQAEGFRIKDGKIAEPLNLITLSGNLLKMLQDLKEFDADVEMTSGGVSIADAYIKSMSIGGINA